MSRLEHSPGRGSRRSRWPLAILVSFPLAPLAKAATPLAGTDSGTLSTLLVLLAGLGMILLAVGVITVAIRELRREGRERRRLYRGRGPADSHGRRSAPSGH